MTIDEFIEILSEAVRAKVQGAPAKIFTVRRTDTEGKQFDQPNATLPQLLAENTDEMRLQNRVMQAHITEMELLRRELKKLNRR